MAFYEAGTPDQNKKKRKSGRSILRIVIDYAGAILIAVAVAFLLQHFVIINAVIPSQSMEYTIEAGDRVIGLRLAYIFSEPARYDIVIFEYPDNENQLFIKRLIGLPGETVVISDGKVYIISDDVDTTKADDEELMADPYMFGNCLLLDDSFCMETPQGGDYYDGVFRVPDDGYFVLGDNRNHSHDSRFWDNKYVTRDEIQGKAVLRYWPLTQIKLLTY